MPTSKVTKNRSVELLARVLLRASLPANYLFASKMSPPNYRKAETILARKFTADERASFREAWQAEWTKYQKERGSYLD